MRGALAGILLAAIIVACGGRQRTDDGFGTRSEILTLWTQIRDWRARASIRVEPLPATLIQMQGKTVGEAKKVCAEPSDVPKPCDDVCSLSDAICDNAERICKLADQLGKDDRFGQEKCASAKASCHEAEQRCCECTDKETP